MKTSNANKELFSLRAMTVNELRQKYVEVFDEDTNARNKDFLIKRIAWRMQVNNEGGLSERALLRVNEIVNEADLRIRPPKSFSMEVPATSSMEKKDYCNQNDPRLPGPGTVITRKYKGRLIMVTVLEDGFEHDGIKYRSLSAIAKMITGSHWNGYKFFGLK